MFDESSQVFLYEDAAEHTDGWCLDLDLPGVSERLGQVGVADVKGPAVEALVCNDQMPGASGSLGWL